jgi:hypothetical protein
MPLRLRPTRGTEPAALPGVTAERLAARGTAGMLSVGSPGERRLDKASQTGAKLVELVIRPNGHVLRFTAVGISALPTCCMQQAPTQNGGPFPGHYREAFRRSSARASARRSPAAANNSPASAMAVVGASSVALADKPGAAAPLLRSAPAFRPRRHSSACLPARPPRSPSRGGRRVSAPGSIGTRFSALGPGRRWCSRIAV